MNRLQSELHRLYLARSPAANEKSPQPAGLIDAQGRVRALVVELRRPASWEVLSAVWYGVQSELALPAPGIAVSGSDAMQLWFSLAEPVDAVHARAFLESLRLRYLPAVDARRITLLPAADSVAPHALRHAALVPAQQVQPDHWSAYVAPDLAPIFSDTPWLDVAPNEEGQATLLRGLETTKPDDFAAACERLEASTRPVPAAAPLPSRPLAAQAALTSQHPVGATPAHVEAERFLLQVMHDDAVALALRIDAAKALLRDGVREDLLRSR